MGQVRLVKNARVAMMIFSRGEVQEGVGVLEKWRDKGYEVGAGVGRVLGQNSSTDDETGPSVMLRVNVRNTCLIIRGGVLLDGGLGNSFVSEHGSKLGVSKGFIGGDIVGI